GFERHLIRQAHQIEFVLSLDHPAARGDRSCARDIYLGRGLSDAIAEYEGSALLDPDSSAADAAILESSSDQTIRILILLPGADICIVAARAVGNLLARPLLFECRTNIKCVALHCQNRCEQPFTVPPAHVGEIDERRAADH